MTTQNIENNYYFNYFTRMTKREICISKISLSSISREFSQKLFSHGMGWDIQKKNSSHGTGRDGEGLPGFIFLGFIFYRGFIYLLRIYWELLAVSVFQRTLILTLAPALVLTLTKYSPSPSLSSHPQELCGTYFKMYEDLLKNPNKPQKNKSR